MEELNNDMDDLFRLAAEKYKLKDPPDNWDDVIAELDQTKPVVFSTKRYLPVIILFILLAASGIIYMLFRTTDNGNKQPGFHILVIKQWANEF